MHAEEMKQINPGGEVQQPPAQAECSWRRMMMALRLPRLRRAVLLRRRPRVPPSWPVKVDTNTNESYMADLESAAQLILNHKDKDINGLDPLPITDDLSKTTSGVQSVFDQARANAK